MQTDNQNNWEALRLQLEQSDRFPGEAPFDKAAAWDQLNSRLKPQSSRRRPILYWVAAAVLLFIAGIGWLQTRPTANPKQGKIITRRLPAPIAPAPDFPTGTNHTASSIATEPVKPLATNNEIPPKQQHRKTRPTPLSIDSIALTPPAIAAPSITLPLLFPDSAAPAFAIKPATVRKLKTIHNNRLNSILYKPELSVGDAGNFAPSPSAYFHFGRNESDNILQIKLPSNN